VRGKDAGRSRLNFLRCQTSRSASYLRAASSVPGSESCWLAWLKVSWFSSATAGKCYDSAYVCVFPKSVTHNLQLINSMEHSPWEANFAHLVRKYSAFYRNLSFIIEFTSPTIEPCPELIEVITLAHNLWRPTLILSSHFCLCFSGGPFHRKLHSDLSCRPIWMPSVSVKMSWVSIYIHVFVWLEI
jgi:hypothetical protein